MQKGLEVALELGDEAEVFATRSRFTSIRIEDGRINGLDSGEVGGIGIRAVVRGKLGFSYTTDPERIEDCAKEAVKLAKVAGSAFLGFSEKTDDYPSVSGIFDRGIVDFDLERGIEDAQAMIDAAKAVDTRIAVTGGSFEVSSGLSWIINSNGVEGEEESTSLGASVSVALGEVSAWEWQDSRLLGEMDFESIGREAAALTVRSQRPVKIEGGKKSVIFTPTAISSLLAATTVNHFLAESMQEKRSPYMKRIGEVVISPHLTIVDDGIRYNGSGSGRFDGEGVRSQRTDLVIDGVLKGFLYDTYSASRDGIQSTGNAARSFDSTPKTAPSNFIIKPGRATLDELIAEVKDGILVTDLIGAHTASRTSGEFSLLVHNGFHLEKGEVEDPINQVMISGSSVELLENVILAGCDTRQRGAIISPSILVGEVQVSQ
jgi:PmbA protein